MLNPNTFGIKNMNQSISSFFKIKTTVHTFKLDFAPSNILNLSTSSNASFFNNFTSLNKNFTTVLININIRIDYMNNDNEIFYKKENIKDIVNICTGDNIMESNCIVDINILDIGVININNNAVSMYITFYTFLDT